MHRAHRVVRALILTAALAATGSIAAAATPPQASVQVRVYDSNHHDYHNWDDSEDRAYRGYLLSGTRNIARTKSRNTRIRKITGTGATAIQITIKNGVSLDEIAKSHAACPCSGRAV